MSGFVNAAPQFIPRGANDKSSKQFLKGESGNGYLVPKFFFWAKKGPEDLQYVSASDLKALYGEETFDRIKKWYNHQTLFMEAAAGTGVNMMVKRLVPSDAGVKANVNVYIDIMDCEISNYLRNSDGSIVTDEKGVKQLDPKNPKIKGYKLKFITESNKDTEPTQEGLLTAKAGTMTKKVVSYVDSETETEIIMVPSETETELVDEVVPNEFIDVEENHPTETVEKEVETGEYNITYVDSTTEFESKMVGTGKFEEKSVKDPSLNKLEKNIFNNILEVTSNDIVDEIKVKPTSELVIKFNKLASTLPSVPFNGSVTVDRSLDGTYNSNIGIVSYANKETLKKYYSTLKASELVSLLSDMNTNSYFRLFDKYTKTDTPTIKLTSKEVNEYGVYTVTYLGKDNLISGSNNKHYEFGMVADGAPNKFVPKWSLQTSDTDLNISADTDLLADDFGFNIELIGVEPFINLDDLSSEGLTKDEHESYYNNAGNLTTADYSILYKEKYATPVLKEYTSSDVEVLVLEDLQIIPNPNNVINFRIEYTDSSETKNVYFNTNDLDKFYTLEINEALNAPEFKLVEDFSSLNLTLKRASDTPDGPLFTDIKGYLIYPYQEPVRVVKPTKGNGNGKWCLAYPSGINDSSSFSETSKDVARLTVFDHIKNDQVLTVSTAAEGFDKQVINLLKDYANNPEVKFINISGKKFVEGFRTIQEEIKELRQVPRKVEVRVPIKKTIQVPKKVMVKKPKTIKVRKPKMVEKVVPVKVETVSYKRSTMYPIFEVKSKYHGEHYNNIGFSLNTNYGNRFDKIIAKGTKLFPYGLSLYHRESLRHAPEVTKTLSDENESTIVLTDASTRNPQTQAFIDFNNVFKSNWYNETSRLLPYKPFELEYFKIYDENLNKVLKDIFATELEAISFIPKQYNDGVSTNFDWYDFIGDTKESLTDQFGLLNIFTCKTSKNVNLQTAILSMDRPELEPGQKEINIGSSKPIFLENGSDGTLTDEEFERLVKIELNKYLDNNSEVQDMAVNKETLFVDSGFSLDVKKAILNFQTLRKDTVTLLSTHMASLGKKYFNLDDTKAIGAVLNTAAKLSPESTYFGTNVARSMIIAGAGLLEDGTYDHYVPLTYEIMVKFCKFAGSPEGKWKYEHRFDSMPGNAITLVKDIQPSTIPNGVKPLLWETNIVYPQNSDRGEYFFPGLQTVYDNETSVLNNPYAMLGLSVSTRVGFKTWVWFTGNSSLKENEFVEAVENYGTNLLNDVFAGILKPVFKCILTEADIQRGNSWLNRIALYGNTGKTICQHDTEIYRMSDYK